MKLILKILYITVCIVFGFIIGILSYNGGVSSNYASAIKNAAETSSYELAKTFSMFNLPFDNDPDVSVKFKSNNTTVDIYNAVNRFDAQYYENGDQKSGKTFTQVQDFYYMFIRNIDFNLNATASGVNNTAVRFYSNEKPTEPYVYYLDVSDKVNSNLYKEYPASKDEVVLNAKRTLSSTYRNVGSNIGFVFIGLNETLVSNIENNIGGKITGFDITDNTGAAMLDKVSVNLDYSQQFFADTHQFVDNIRYYYDHYDDKDKDENQQYKDAIEYVNNFKVADLGGNYSEGYDKGTIYSSGIIWQTVGIEALMLLSFAIIFILIFKFKWIKRIVFREKSNNKYTPNRAPNRQVIDAKLEPKQRQTRKQNNYQAKREALKRQAAETKSLEENVENTNNSVDNNTDSEEVSVEIPEYKAPEVTVDNSTEDAKVIDVEVEEIKDDKE